MDVPSRRRLTDLDTRAWCAATWTTALVAPLFAALALGLLWLSSRWPSITSREPLWFFASAVVVGLVALPGVLLLWRSPSARLSGMALGTAGAGAIVFVGVALIGLLYAS
jgi:hypothetical protein